jgi:hypothetical protein
MEEYDSVWELLQPWGAGATPLQIISINKAVHKKRVLSCLLCWMLCRTWLQTTVPTFNLFKPQQPKSRAIKDCDSRTRRVSGNVHTEVATAAGAPP